MVCLQCHTEFLPKAQSLWVKLEDFWTPGESECEAQIWVGCPFSSYCLAVFIWFCKEVEMCVFIPSTFKKDLT